MKLKLTKVQKKSYFHRTLSVLISHGEQFALSISPDHGATYSEMYEFMGFDELNQRFGLWKEWRQQVKTLLAKKEWAAFVVLETLPFVTASEIWEAVLLRQKNKAQNLAQADLNPDPETGEIATLGSFWRILGPMVRAQCAYLRTIRKQHFPGLPVSDDVALAFAAHFKQVNTETIDRLFAVSGAGFWWVEPCSEVKSSRQTYVLGWLEGIALHEPDALLGIMQHALQALAVHQDLSEPDPVLLEALSAALA